MITFFFKTYGCQANVADSDGIAKYLLTLGCSQAPSEETADLIIVNTCAVRDKAEQKLFSYIGQLSDLKIKRPYINLGVIGCVASYKKEEIYKRFDQINFVYSAREEMELFHAYLTDLIVRLETTKQLFVEGKESQEFVEQDRDVKKIVQTKGLLGASRAAAILLKKRVKVVEYTSKEPELNRSFINIMTGCNKYCTYCIVPFTRGKEVSYAAQDILNRVEHDVINGAKEVTLVGQNVNSYRDPVTGTDFSELLRNIVKIKGEFWVRWVSPHPQDMTVELFDVIKQHPDRIPWYVHFPVQSGSSRVLEVMRRNYTREQYLEQIAWLRERMPNAVISTDIIVGFPGETEEDYRLTRDLMELVKFDFIFSFVYSPRRYTRAANMKDDCPITVKQQRLEDLQKRQIEICLERNSAWVGKKMKTLVEKRLSNGKLLARTEGNLRVVFDGPSEIIGNFVTVMIDRAAPAQLEATLISERFFESVSMAA